ncbi:hypothetical protein [Candidatus Nitrosotalea okcheonensis]|uniref:Uncharacterized protein n=1 Tax=Candidatus Nitrosotalea okcheonensis TaxID=1903276 RepID=A0A2H1FEV1_9ARCH|nr:hypothetical protein [Candidatus Nitrosotalea okcheonensis]SMH71284.1 protein of unknown function [Candidatus Nitrosotalea okcheonensis]
MISLPAGVKIVKFYDAEMQKTGKGILYLLNDGIMFEKRGEGVKFECNFDYLASFEAVKRDKLLVVIRTSDGRKSIEFKVNTANQVEYDISEVNQEYARNTSPDFTSDIKNIENHDDKFDQNAHSLSEARWFQDNWNDIMKFLKLERVTYLNEYVKNAKIGTPDVDPYLLVVDYENLTYKDFADLPGFLKWRYDTMSDKEVDMMVDVFRDFEDFSVRTLEMDVQMCKPLEHNFTRKGYLLYQFVTIVAREKLESGKKRQEVQSQATKS